MVENLKRNTDTAKPTYSHFSYAETWELVNLFADTKDFCPVTDKHSQKY